VSPDVERLERQGRVVLRTLARLPAVDLVPLPAVTQLCPTWQEPADELASRLADHAALLGLLRKRLGDVAAAPAELCHDDLVSTLAALSACQSAIDGLRALEDVLAEVQRRVATLLGGLDVVGP
jgi:hypothetical protein